MKVSVVMNRQGNCMYNYFLPCFRPAFHLCLGNHEKKSWLSRNRDPSPGVEDVSRCACMRQDGYHGREVDEKVK